MKKVYIIIPAKDEENRIPKVIHAILEEGFSNIVVVNDGSSDKTEQVAKGLGATVLNHMVNLGAGAATQTGIEYAIEKGADVIVTIDGDNQHYPSDIKRLLREMEEQDVDVVIGSRFLNQTNASVVPIHRKAYNKIGNVFTAAISGLVVSDSQSGLKAMRANFARKINLQFNGYEFCTEFIKYIKHHKASYSEVPIQVRYNQDTLQKGQSFGNGVKMVVNLVRYFW